ncbi:MAG: HdeD family acid-resistance protein [Hyphomicrobiales bacterium]
MDTLGSSTLGGRPDLPRWLCVLLAIVFILVGLVVLGDVVLASVISTIVIGICAIIGGAFEIVHAFWTKGWGGFIVQIILGLLYIAGGIILVNNPIAGSLAVTYALGLILLATGMVRIFVGIRGWAEGGWLLFLSGIFGILAGLVILVGWPVSGLWVIGFLVGVDLVFHGVGWFAVAWRPRQSAA